MSALQQVQLADVFPNPGQPRKTFDGIEELAESLRRMGLLQPITVTPREGRFMIVAGERRYRAACHAGWSEIPALVIEVNDADVFEVAVMENVARQAMDPIEEAAALATLLDMGRTAAELDASLGYGSNGSTTLWKVQVLKCREEIQHLVSRSQLTLTKAIQLAKLTPDGQLRVMREFQKRPMTDREYAGFCEAVWAQENAIDMFPETKLSDDQRAAVDAFTKALSGIGKTVAALDGLDRTKLAEGLKAHGLTAAAQLEETIRQLRRVKNMLQEEQGRQAAIEGDEG